MNIYSLSVLLFSFGVLLIALLAFFKRKDAIAIRFALFSISVCGWGFLYSFWTSQNYPPEETLQLIRISELSAVFIPVTWLHFVMEFVGKKEPFKYFYRMNYILAVILAIFCPTPWFFTGVHLVPVFHYYKTAGPVFYVFLAVFLTLVPYAFYHLTKAYADAVGQVKEQLRFLILGWLISFAAGGATFLPVFNITDFLFLLCLMPVYPVFTGLALIRYGLFDEEHLIESFQREKLMAIGTMAASLNHEIRNPLFIAKGKTETFLDGAERGLYGMDEKTKEVLNCIYSQLTRASDIMQRFADFAKPFYTEIRKEKVVVRDAFQNVLQLVSGEFQMNRINVQIMPSNGLSVYANPRHFEEILFNLMINACHAIENNLSSPNATKLSSSNASVGESKGTITLSAYQPNGKVIVEVSDNGPGIPKDKQSKIFQPFYSTKGGKGSGLGLYITKQLVERNNGKISVKSKLHEGTTFRVELSAV